MPWLTMTDGPHGVACNNGHVGTVKLLLSRAAPAVPIAVPTLIKATLRSTAIEDENVRAEIVEMLRDGGHGVEYAI